MTYQGSVPRGNCASTKSDSRRLRRSGGSGSTMRLLLDQDLFAGDQHALKLLPALPPPASGIHAAAE